MKFILLELKYKMLLMILTFIYFGISYYLEFKINLFEKINGEIIILVMEYLIYRYLIFFVDDDFNIFTMNKIKRAIEAE